MNTKNDISIENDDTRIGKIEQVLPPIALLEKYPASSVAVKTVENARHEAHNIIHGEDDRLLVVIGPCSIHDPKAALEYAKRIKLMREKYQDTLQIIMRVYFEKPRTTVGWKGLINDPYLNNTYALNDGLRIARKLLSDINDLTVPTAGEFLDMITPQYLADFMSWGAIGAAEAPHHFLSVTKFGHSAIVSTKGNEDCHIILRGGDNGPNYSEQDVAEVCDELAKAGYRAHVMVDFSHANSCKQFKKQLDVSRDVARQIAAGSDKIFGVMIESHLVEGRQDLVEGKPLTYGQSITDSCIGWEDSENVLQELSDAVAARRKLNG